MQHFRIDICRLSLENSAMEKLFNKFDTTCQSESEFVNHSMAASKSGSDLFGIA